MQRGEQALAGAKTGAAREAFQLALAIQPGHPPAAAGLARAGRHRRGACARGRARAATNRQAALADAEAGYRKALAIDGGVPGAQEGLDRLAAGRSADAYSAAMSRGFADAAAGRNDAARDRVQPGARRCGRARARRMDAIAALDRGQRASALRLLEARARTAESDERWDEALTAWREAAGLEPTLESAREGLARATPRAELQRRIDALNAEPGTPVERGGSGGGSRPRGRGRGGRQSARAAGGVGGAALEAAGRGLRSRRSGCGSNPTARRRW